MSRQNYDQTLEEIPQFKSIPQLYAYIEKEAKLRVRKLIKEGKKVRADGGSRSD